MLDTDQITLACRVDEANQEVTELTRDDASSRHQKYLLRNGDGPTPRLVHKVNKQETKGSMGQKNVNYKAFYKATLYRARWYEYKTQDGTWKAVENLPQLLFTRYKKQRRYKRTATPMFIGNPRSGEVSSLSTKIVYKAGNVLAEQVTIMHMLEGVGDTAMIIVRMIGLKPRDKK